MFSYIQISQLDEANIKNFLIFNFDFKAKKSISNKSQTNILGDINPIISKGTTNINV